MKNLMNNKKIPTPTDSVLSTVAALARRLPTVLLMLIASQLASSLAHANGGAPADREIPKQVSKTEYFNERITKDLLSTIGPIDKKALLGTWKLVMVGPAVNDLGVYNAQGIAVDNKGTVPMYQFLATDLTWLTNGANTQLNMRQVNIPVVGTHYDQKNYEYPMLLVQAGPVNVQLVGDTAQFELKFFSKLPISTTCNKYGIVFDSKYTCEYGVSFSYSTRMKCGLQAEHPERMLCEMLDNKYVDAFQGEFYDAIKLMRVRIPQQTIQYLLAPLLGFERVNTN